MLEVSQGYRQAGKQHFWRGCDGVGFKVNRGHADRMYVIQFDKVRVDLRRRIVFRFIHFERKKASNESTMKGFCTSQ